MDQPPGSLDELQPQDLSTCSIPSVVDLTRKGEATSLEAMRMGKSPRWYPNSGNGRTGLPLAEAASSDIGVQSGEQIQSDTAFSNTTVTLSYVSRSHVFSSQDSLSAHSSLYAVPSIPKFSLQSSCESENGLGDEAGYPLSQHYRQHSDGPLDLATPTQLFQALAQAQVRDEGDESQLCLTQPGSHRLNGGLLCGEGQTDVSLQGAFESGLPREPESSLSLENGGQCHDWPASGHSSPNTIEPQGSGNLRSSELVQAPGTQEPSVVGEGAGGGEMPLPGKGHSSSLEDHASPASAISPGQASVPGAQASRPPGTVHAYTEEADEVIWDGPDTGSPIEPFPSEEAQCSGDAGASRPTDELTDHGELPKELASNAKNKMAVVPRVNGNTTTLPGSSPPRRKLPARLGRGTRLEALVLNICPSAYKDAAPAGKTPPKAPKKAAAPSHPPRSPPPGKEDRAAGGPEKASVSAEGERERAARAASMGTSERIAADDCKDSTSVDCESFSNSKNLHNGTPSHAAAPRFPARGKPEWAPPVPPRVTYPAAAPADLEPGEIDFPYTLPEDEPKAETPTKSPKKSPSGAKASGVRGSPPTKAARPPKRRRAVAPGGHASSMFSPMEPEIKLKYVTYKEERRDPRLDSFSPLVRVRPQPPASRLYTVINYAEEDSTRRAGRPHGSPGGFLSGTTPGTSCLRPGRVSAHGQHRRSLVCCLCGASANATGLGDLHGPYYPEGYRPAGKTKASASGPETSAAEAEEEEEEGEGGDEEDSSDSDSSASSCSMRGAGGRRRARPPPGSWPQPGPPGSPAAKQARMEAGGGGLQAVDWYSPPVVAQEPAEYWLHEDCSVWAAGVFLVKGKVYGLEEAVKVAQATMCSGCRNPGATLGCLFKGCPSKYHYRCAVESDCVLVEENFSMRCKKHKNKSLKAPGGNRRDGR